MIFLPNYSISVSGDLSLYPITKKLCKSDYLLQLELSIYMVDPEIGDIDRDVAKMREYD